MEFTSAINHMGESNLTKDVQAFFARRPSRRPKPLGTGGWGAVYPLGPSMALKAYLKDKCDITEPARQIHLASRLPAAPHFFEGGNIRGRLYLVMEKLIGCDAHYLSKSFRTLRNEVQYRVASDIIEAGCRQTWKKGLSHRDVKAENCFLDTQGNMHILDFDFLMEFPPLENTVDSPLTTYGTVGYMAPEAACGTTSRKTDLYGSGATLFRLATDQHLSTVLGFRSNIFQCIKFYQQPAKKTQPKIHRAIRKNVADPFLRTLISEMLIVDPEQRPSPDDLPDDITAHAADRNDVVKEIAAVVKKFGAALRHT